MLLLRCLHLMGHTIGPQCGEPDGHTSPHRWSPQLEATWGPLTPSDDDPSPVFCVHANEHPLLCPCPENCYCADKTCRGKPRVADIRTFATGATRNVDSSRIDPEGFLSPQVILEFSNYMNTNRIQADGSVRSSDNWQRGIPLDAYMKSLWRHFLEVWLIHRAEASDDTKMRQALCGVMFNAMGYLFEVLMKREK